MNRLTVTGTVVADPVSVVLADGSLLATFTVADSTRPADAECALFRCTARGRTAAAVDEYLSAGSPVFIDGELVPVCHAAGDKADWLDLRVLAISSALFVAYPSSERDSA